LPQTQSWLSRERCLDNVLCLDHLALVIISILFREIKAKLYKKIARSSVQPLLSVEDKIRVYIQKLNDFKKSIGIIYAECEPYQRQVFDIDNLEEYNANNEF
jgi:hypothetical protein